MELKSSPLKYWGARKYLNNLKTYFKNSKKGNRSFWDHMSFWIRFNEDIFLPFKIYKCKSCRWIVVDAFINDFWTSYFLWNAKIHSCRNRRPIVYQKGYYISKK
jgi:hypothetical protein